MDALQTAKQKLEIALDVIKNAQDYTKSIQQVLEVLDDGLQFAKANYSELNTITMAQNKNLKGSDIYFFFTRFTHQFFNVMNIIQTLPNAGYYAKFLHLLEVRQQRFSELCTDALNKGNKILIN